MKQEDFKDYTDNELRQFRHNLLHPVKLEYIPDNIKDYILKDNPTIGNKETRINRCITLIDKEAIMRFNKPVGIDVFTFEKEKLVNKLNVILDEYDKFSKKVSPKHWRLTGTHFTQLRIIQEEIQKFSEISDEEKESEWVKEQLK